MGESPTGPTVRTPPGRSGCFASRWLAGSRKIKLVIDCSTTYSALASKDAGGQVEQERERRPPDRRKDRVVQARVPRDLASTLEREARRRRLTVSHLIRNVLEDTFQLVDDVVANVDEIVSDSVELARRVGRDARRVASAVRDAVATDVREEEAEDVTGGGSVDRAVPDGTAATEYSQAAAEPGDPLAHVYAWNQVVANREVVCSRCGSGVARGAEGWVGLSDDPRSPRAWLCPACREAL